MIGHIIRIVSNRYDVIADDGQRLTCGAAGRLRLGVSPVVGDLVSCQLQAGQGQIVAISPRRNQLIRPAIANVDQAMIVMSAVDPDFSPVLVDRLVFLISYQDIEPVIVVTKMDLAPADHPVHAAIADYRAGGYQVILTGRELELDAVRGALKGRITVLAGQSGVGKSTLLNRLDPQLALATQAISQALGRGKHTTRHTELYPVAGGWLADTPGFSSLDFSHVDALTMAQKIRDFQGVGSCRFLDCRHLQEPGCAVKQGVAQGRVSAQRYQDYVEAAAMCNQVADWQLNGGKTRQP